MAKESEVVREIHSLDSDMQTLVYENYNKFISATDTINKMRVDFRETVSRSYVYMYFVCDYAYFHFFGVSRILGLK